MKIRVEYKNSESDLEAELYSKLSKVCFSWIEKIVSTYVIIFSAFAHILYAFGLLYQTQI